jgi:hypothetical protein
MIRFSLWSAVLGCSCDVRNHDALGDDGQPATDHQDDADVEVPTASSSAPASAIEGNWLGGCVGEVLPPATTTHTDYEATILMCDFALAEEPVGILGGELHIELWYSFSDWEYLMGEGDLVLDGTMHGADVDVDILRDTVPIGTFDLLLSGDTLAGELQFIDENGIEYTDSCLFTRG